MAEGKKRPAKPFYSGLAVYMGPDDPMTGLNHARDYNITARKLKSGRIRVEVYEALVNHVTCESEDIFKKTFVKRANRKKRSK